MIKLDRELVGKIELLQDIFYYMLYYNARENICYVCRDFDPSISAFSSNKLKVNPC